jgi:type II secretory pathway pseudopilin PulG
MRGKYTRSGFTLIEVLLFLALSTVIIVALMTGITQTVARQRYNDSVQSFTQFLRSQYTGVITTTNGRPKDDPTCGNYAKAHNALIGQANILLPPEFNNPNNFLAMNAAATANADDPLYGGRGRSDCNLYGKLILFGRRDMSVSGAVATDAVTSAEANHVVVYDVIGRDLTDEIIAKANAKDGQGMQGISDIMSYILTVPVLLDGSCNIGNQSYVTKYSLEWQARVEQGSTTPAFLQAGLLIIRSPITGTVHTMTITDASIINRISNSVASGDAGTCNFNGSSTNGHTLWQILGSKKASLTEGLKMCIGSDDTYATNGMRRMINIKADGRNGTAVELVQADLRPNPSKPTDAYNECVDWSHI